jgi:hypothetical protein
VPWRGRRSAAASCCGDEGTARISLSAMAPVCGKELERPWQRARFEEDGRPAVVNPLPNPRAADAVEEPRLSTGLAEEPRPSDVPLLRVTADEDLRLALP